MPGEDPESDKAAGRAEPRVSLEVENASYTVRTSRGVSLEVRSVHSLEHDKRGSVRLLEFAMDTVVEGQIGEHLGENHEGLTFQQAVLTFVINCVGAGVVLFPRIMADTGMLIAPLLCCICAFTCKECGVMMSTACELSEEAGVPIANYERLAELAGGPYWKNALFVTKNLAMLGFVIAYMQLVIDNIAEFFPQSKEDKPVFFIRFCIAMPIFCVLAMLKSLKQLASFSTISLSAVIAECACIILGGCYMFFNNPSCADKGVSAADYKPAPGEAVVCREYDLFPTVKPAEQLGKFGSHMALFLFAFAVLATVPSVRSQMNEPKQMHKVLSSAFTILSGIFIFVMFCGYAGFGVMVGENVIIDLSGSDPRIGSVACAAILVSVLGSVPLFIFCLVSVFESSGTGKMHTPFTIPNIGIRCTLIIVLAVIGAAVPYLGEVLALISSVFGVCNNIFFPCILHVLARKTAGVMPAKPGLRLIKYIGSVLIGIFVMCFGFKGALLTLLQKLDEDSKMTAAASAGQIAADSVRAAASLVAAAVSN